MKTKFFNSLSPLSFRRGVGVRLLFVLLISLPFGEGWGGMLMAQNGVTVSNLAVETGSPATVTFDVRWSRDDIQQALQGLPVQAWSDTVWVFVDYNESGAMKRLPLTSGATLTATSAPGTGTVLEETGNNTGVWVVGNARTSGSFSATVQLLTNTSDVAGMCAYVSNYPPVGRYTALSELAFTGTKPYEIVLRSEGGATTSVLINDGVYAVPEGSTVESFSDKTGAPGTFTCVPPTTYTLSGSNVCLNGTVTLTLQSSQEGWKYQLYKGGAAVGDIKDGTAAALAFTDAASATGVFSYTVQTVDLTGVQCETQVSNVQGVTVQELPATPVIAGASTVCVDALLTVYVSAPVDGATYTWTGSAGTASTDSNSYTFNTSADGSKTATVRSSVTAGGVVCQSAISDVSTSTVNAVPATPAIAGASTVCVDALLTVYVSAPVDGATYTWTGSAGTASTDSNSYTFNTSADGAKTATVRSSVTAGGVVCQSAMSDVSTSTVNATPSTTITVLASTVCAGAVLTFTASTVTGGTYSWMASPGTPSANSYTFDTSTAGAKTATVSVSVASGGVTCTSGTMTASTATVYALPSSTVTDRTICSGTTSALSATVNSAGTTSAMTYSWKVGAAATTTTTGNTYTSGALTVTSSYTVQITNSNGCSATSNVGTVTVNAIPTTSITVSASTVCAGAALSYTASAVTNGTYTWTASTGSFNGSTYTFNTAAAGARTATVSVSVLSNGVTCTSGTMTASASTVIALPSAPTVAVGEFCFGLPGQLEATASGSTVTWHNAASAGTLLSTGSVLSLTPLYSNAAAYYAQATASNGCVSSSRTQASYTVSNCMMSGACPNFTAGDVGASAAPAACGVFYSGQIGAASYPAACVSLDAGRIGGN